MPASATNAAGGEPRPARYLIPRDAPRRGEIVAALGLFWLVAHLLFAQLTLLLSLALAVTGRVARWRPLWLAAPAAAGLVWVLAIGPAAAVRGFIDGPRQVLGYFAGAMTDPARLVHPAYAYAGISRWLPRQAPLALLAAAAEAAVAWWVRWLHAGTAGLPAVRPGLIAVARRQLTVRTVKSGGVVSRSGACLGADWQTGRPVDVPWAAAAGGVLVAGARPAAVAAASFQLVHAAIRRRKPVVVVDLAGTVGLAGALATVCADAGAPLRVLHACGPGCYEPLRGGAPARQAALVMGMIDWGEATDQVRRTCGNFLNDLFAVAAAAPGDPAAGVLADVAALLSPAALRARVRQVPPDHPGREALAGRLTASASLLHADPASAAFLTGELSGLRGSSLGRWLRPAVSEAGEEQISLAGAVRDRAVALFSLGASGNDRAARMIANLVALDLQAVLAESARLGVGGDELAWFSNCAALADAALAGLIAARAPAGPATGTSAGPARGSAAGPAIVLSTVSRSAAARLAAAANVLVLPGVAAPDVTDLVDWAAAGPVRPDRFALVIKGPPRRVVPDGRFVAAGLR
jgi:hypothetical protein